MPVKPFRIAFPSPENDSVVIPLLEAATSYKYSRDGSCLIATQAETTVTSFVTRSALVLQVNSPELAEEILRETRALLLEEAQPHVKAPERITLFSDFGFLSELYELQLRFFLEPEPARLAFLRKKFVPWLKGNGIQRLYALTSNLKIQRRISLAKVLFFLKKLSLADVEKRIDAAERGPLPDLQAPLQLIDALLILGPIGIAVPFSRFDSKLLLVKSQHWFFPHQARENALEIWFASHAPLSGHGVSMPPKLAWHKKVVDSYIDFSIFCSNRLWDYATDLGNFVNEGKFDERQMLMCASNVNLLIADVLALVQSNNKYVKRHTFFAFLDKLANLCLLMSREKPGKAAQQKEAAIRNWLFGGWHSDLSVSLIKRGASAVNVRLGEYLENWSREQFRAWATSLMEASPQDGEAVPGSHGATKKLSDMWRNISHGVSSGSGRFEDVVLHASSDMPTGTDVFAVFTLMALCCNPGEFLIGLKNHPG